MDQATKDALDARLAKMASVGATILSNASAARRLLAEVPVTTQEQQQFGGTAMGEGGFGG